MPILAFGNNELFEVLIWSCICDSRLVDWCAEYCHVQVVDLNPTVYRVFYSGCQVGNAILFFMNFQIFNNAYKLWFMLFNLN